MAAATFSRNVLKMFYGPITNEENQRPSIRPRRSFDFEIARFVDVCENEVKTLTSVQIQFGLLVRF